MRAYCRPIRPTILNVAACTYICRIRNKAKCLYICTKHCIPICTVINCTSMSICIHTWQIELVLVHPLEYQPHPGTSHPLLLLLTFLVFITGRKHKKEIQQGTKHGKTEFICKLSVCTDRVYVQTKAQNMEKLS